MSLAAVLDTLLPGTAEDWPRGSAVLAAVAADLADDPALAAVLAALPPGFVAGDAEAREAALRAIEAAEPRAFERVVAAAYVAYYTDPDVRRVVERITGYEARPPQPLGYDLPPFDETLLDTQKRRAPFWRKA